MLLLLLLLLLRTLLLLLHRLAVALLLLLLPLLTAGTCAGTHGAALPELLSSKVHLRVRVCELTRAALEAELLSVGSKLNGRKGLVRITKAKKNPTGH